MVGISSRWVPGAPPDYVLPQAAMRAIRYLITGITKDSTGAALGGVTVEIYETIPGVTNPEPKGRFVNATLSDANGNYSVEVHGIPGATFQGKATKGGGTPVAGVTVDTLTAVIT